MRSLLLIFLSVILLAGCAAPVSRWREDAFSRFNSAVAAGSLQSAPEETENIRQTLALADRYFTRNMSDDAERLYQLSYQKSQLLYRNLVLSKVRQGSTLLVQNETTKQSEEIVISVEPVSLREVLEQVEHGQAPRNYGMSNIVCDETAEVESVPLSEPAGVIPENESGAANIFPVAPLDNEQRERASEHKTLPAPLSKEARSVPAAPKPEKRVSRSRTGAARCEPGRTTIYLTFDDGPSRLTLPIAAYLNSQGVAATFFALGSNIKGHEKVVRDTVALGHHVGNHTLSHDLRKLNASLHQSVNEIEKTAAMVEKLGGDGKW